MKLVLSVVRFVGKALWNNGAFLLFMLALGLVCAFTEVYPDRMPYKVYRPTYVGLLTGVATLCLLLQLLPEKARTWVRRAIYLVAYVLAVVDVFCFVKFDTPISPTIVMVMLETNSGEAGEFFSTYVTPDLLRTSLVAIAALLVVHIAWGLIRKKGLRLNPIAHRLDIPLSLAAIAVLVYGFFYTYKYKENFVAIMTAPTIGQLEERAAGDDGLFSLYAPLHRAMYGLYANHLVYQQTDALVETVGKTTVDSCSTTSKTIVLIIGESYNRHHSSQYGYDKPTTPRQSEREARGELTKFTDVIAPWNVTSFVFKYLFSVASATDKQDWGEAPLFPVLFRKAGYNVAFLTNQFVVSTSNDTHDFSGGFFLNDSRLSQAQFDYRNTEAHDYDDGLIDDYRNMMSTQSDTAAPRLVIFHLIGQHFRYSERYPDSRRRFRPQDYQRPALDESEKAFLADYDNATLYNDSVVDAILHLFDNEDAVAIYVPDHGESIYDFDTHVQGRTPPASVTAEWMWNEIDIPFWIWRSEKYAATHADICQQIESAKDRRFMTDNLAQVLLHLAGIHTKWYKAEDDLLSGDYDEKRPRLVRRQTDYDDLDVRAWEQKKRKQQRHG